MRIRPSGPGSVVITASYGGKTAQCQVTCSPADRVGVVTDAQLGLNVRSGPGTEHPVAGKLADGARVLVMETLEGWYRILFLNAQRQAAEGFVSADYLVLIDN